MQVSHTQKGRTLLEMMAVISLMGLLAIGGTTGLAWGLSRVQAIQLIKDVGARAVLIETSPSFKAKPINENFSVVGFASQSGRYHFIHKKLGPQDFSIYVSNIQQRVCEQLEHVASSSSANYFYINCSGGLNGNFSGCQSPLEHNGTLCEEGNGNTLTLVFGDGTVDTSGEGGGYTPQDDSCPVSEMIPCGKPETYPAPDGTMCTRYVEDCPVDRCFNNVCVCPEGMKWDSETKDCVENTGCTGAQPYWNNKTNTCQACIIDSHCDLGEYCTEAGTCQACSVGLCGSCEMETPWRPYWDGTTCICTTDETCEAYGYGQCGGNQCTEFCQAREGTACDSNDDCCDGYFCDMAESSDSCTTPTTGRCQRIDMKFNNGWACSKKTVYSKYDAENICAALNGTLLDEATARTSQIPIQTACRNLNAKAWTSTAFGSGTGSCWSYTMDCQKNATGAAKNNATGFEVVCAGENLWQCARDNDCTSPTGAVCNHGTCECLSNSYLQDGACITCDAEKHQVASDNSCVCAEGFTESTQDGQTTCCPNACSTKEDCCNGFECVAGACVAATWQCNNLCTGSKYCRVNDSPAGNVDGACGVTDITYTCTTGGVGSFYEGFALTNGNNHSWWDAWNRCNAAGLRLATRAEHAQYNTHVKQLVKNIAYYWLADEDGCKAYFGYVGNVWSKNHKTWGNSANANGDGNRLHGLCIKDPTEQCTGNQAYAHDMTCRDCPSGSHPSEDRRTCVCEGGEGTFDKTNNTCTYTDNCEDGYKFDEETSRCVPDWKCNSLCDTSYQFCKVGSTPTNGATNVCPTPGAATQTCATRGSETIRNGIYARHGQFSWYDAWNYCDSIGGHLLTDAETTAYKDDLIAVLQAQYYWKANEINTEAKPCFAGRFAYFNGVYSAQNKELNKSSPGERIVCMKNDIKTCPDNQVHTNEGDCQTCPDNATKDPTGDTCICANGTTWDRGTNTCLVTDCPPGKTLYAGKYCLSDPWKCNELCPKGYYCRGHAVDSSKASICPDGSDLNPQCVKLPKLSFEPYKGFYPIRTTNDISWYDAWNLCDAMGMTLINYNELEANYQAAANFWNGPGGPLWTAGGQIEADCDNVNKCCARRVSITAGSSYGRNRVGKRASSTVGVYCQAKKSNCRSDQVMLNDGTCVTCPENANISGDTCLCNVLGSGTYNATTNTCTYDICATEAHLENGQCVCNDGSALNTDTKQCVTTDCTTPETCGCAPNQYMNSAFQCVDCTLGNEPDSTQTKQVRCTNVNASCASCAAADPHKPYWNDVEQVCQGCASSHYMSNGACKRCAPGQRANDEGTACVDCVALAENKTADCPSCAFYNPQAHFWNSFLRKCTSCERADQVEENGVCQACPVGMTLKADGTCDCSNGFYSDLAHKCCAATCSTSADCCAELGMTCQSGQCKTCQGNTILHDGACVACPTGSTAIKDGTECQCPAGYEWDAATATCVACPTGYYSENNVCVQCEMGRYIENNQCKPCTKNSAAHCEDLPCTTQDHCGGYDSGYYCYYTSPQPKEPGAGTCKPIGGHTVDHLPTNKDIYFSNTILDFWSARNWCVAFGKKPYECQNAYSESGHSCPDAIQLNLMCPDLIGWDQPYNVYLQPYNCTGNYACAYFSYRSAVNGSDGNICGGWARNRTSTRAFCID